MPDYSQGKIYKVVSPNHSKIYIGSTVQTLEKRFSKHKSERNCCSTEIIEVGDAEIILIEDFPCLDKYQLEDREAEYQLMDWDGCVNRYVAGAIRRAGGMKAYKKARKHKFITCFCGVEIQHREKARHQRTKRHLKFVEIISIV